jgi:hypothetical protein
MNVDAAVARLLDVGGKSPLRITLVMEPRGRTLTGATLAPSVLLTPIHGGPRCPHCGAKSR